MIIRSMIAIKIFGFILRMNPAAVAFFPFIFIGPKTILTNELINHEKIHLRQQIELLIIPFYIWYLIEFFRKGYRNISFEKEAYANENNLKYLETRSWFSFFDYLQYICK